MPPPKPPKAPSRISDEEKYREGAELFRHLQSFQRTSLVFLFAVSGASIGIVLSHLENRAVNMLPALNIALTILIWAGYAMASARIARIGEYLESLEGNGGPYTLFPYRVPRSQWKDLYRLWDSVRNAIFLLLIIGWVALSFIVEEERRDAKSSAPPPVSMESTVTSDSLAPTDSLADSTVIIRRNDATKP